MSKKNSGEPMEYLPLSKLDPWDVLSFRNQNFPAMDLDHWMALGNQGLAAVDSQGKIQAMVPLQVRELALDNDVTVKAGYMNHVAVDSKLRGQGVGSTLVQKLEAHYKDRIPLGMVYRFDCESKAYRFYQAQGYQTLLSAQLYFSKREKAPGNPPDRMLKVSSLSSKESFPLEAVDFFLHNGRIDAGGVPRSVPFYQQIFRSHVYKGGWILVDLENEQGRAMALVQRNCLITGQASLYDWASTDSTILYTLVSQLCQEWQDEEKHLGVYLPEADCRQEWLEHFEEEWRTPFLMGKVWNGGLLQNGQRSFDRCSSLVDILQSITWKISLLDFI